MKLIKTLFVVPATALLLVVGSAQAQDDAAVAQRLKPVGTVCIKGEVCDEKLAPVAEEKETQDVAETEVAAEEAKTEQVVASAGRSGEDVYKLHCTACHATGLLSSPLTGDTAAWKERYDARGGIDALVQVSKEGTPAGMPPMGTCSSCSDDELKSAISFMSGM